VQAIRIDEPKALLLIVPKTASTSIRRRLFPDKGESSVWEYVTDCRRAKWPGWFRFAFVRNPWERLVSCWAEKIHDRDVIFRGFTRYGWTTAMSFPAFVEAVCRMDPAEHDHHFASQCSLLRYEGEWCVDYVGRYESLDQDWERLAGILPHMGPLGRFIVSEHQDYHEYYTPALWTRAGKVFAEDVTVFGYPHRR
jgi:hypothetical protein